MPKLVDPQQRRTEVADALFRLVVRDGLAAVSLRTVAAEAELNVGSVRHYFGDQTDLLRFAMRTVIDRVRARLEARIAAAGDPAEQDAAARRDARVEILGELLPLDPARRAEVTVYLEFLSAARTDRRLADLADEAVAGTVALARRSLGRDGATDRAVHTLVALLDGLAVAGTRGPRPLPPEDQRAVLRAHLEP